MARVEIPAPGDLIMDEEGRPIVETVALTLAADRVAGVLGTGSAATHYSALSGGSSATGGLKSASDGTIVDLSGNRRYVDSGVPLDLTIAGRSRQLDPLSASVETRVAASELKTRFVSVRNPIGAYSGALGDGSTDDTAVIQAWIDWVEANLATTRVVYFPAGNYIVSGITATKATLLGEAPSRAAAGLVNLSTDLGSRLIHKTGATTPLITTGGGTSALGWERVQYLTLQGKQNQNLCVPRRPITAVADRRNFTVATGHVPTATVGTDFPGYGVCVFYDANGYRIGTGVVATVNTGTGQIGLFDGTDNYTGVTGSSDLLTTADQVAFAPSVTYTSDGVTQTAVPDSTMISPPAILNMGRSKIIDDCYIKDFHCGVVLSDTVARIPNVWTNNCGMAGVALRTMGSGADVQGGYWFLQGGGAADMGQSAPAIGRINANGNWSLCGVWGLPSKSNLGDIICDEGYHGIIDKGNGSVQINSFLADKPFKEPFISWGGFWSSGIGDPTVTFDAFLARTVGQGLTSPTTLNFPTHARSVIGVRGSNHRKVDVGSLTAARFDAASLSGDDFACVSNIYEAAINGKHEVFIRSIPWRNAATSLASGVATFAASSTLVPPKMTTAERDAIAGPFDGLLAYNSDVAKFQGRAGGGWVDLELDQHQKLVAPPGFGFALLGAGVNAGSQVPRGARLLVPKTGVLHDLIVYVVVSSGNYNVAIFDTGDASAGNRTKLWESGSTATPAINAWRVVGDPSLAVKAGQQLDVVIAFDNATASIGRFTTPAAIAAMTELPSGFLAAAGGALPKMLIQYPNLTALAWTTPVAEASVTDAVNAYAILGRVT